MGAKKTVLAFFFAACFAVILAADPLCEGLPAGEVIPFPHEYNCTLYYECQDGNKNILQCSSGLYFNNITQSCDFPEASGCVMSYDPMCADLPGGITIAFPHEKNCSLYYECLNGNKSLLMCDGDLYFNNNTQSCDFPVASGCKNVDESCVGKDLDYLPHPEDCTQYIECYNGDSYLMNCPNGYFFDSKTKMCVLPELSDCSASTTPWWTTPHPTCWGVKPNETILKPYDGDCRKYWRCIGSNLELEYCPGGLLFDENRQLCDFPDTVSCDDSTRTPDPNTVTPPFEPSTPAFDHDPRCIDGGISYWPHPATCHLYIECYHNISYEMECPPGLYFSDDVKKCVNPGDSDCGKVSTDSTQTPTTPENWTPDDDCPYPESEGKLLPYPGDCTKYYECAEGKKVEMFCPPNLWFNPAGYCDYPYQANCSWGKLSFFHRLSNYFKWF